MRNLARIKMAPTTESHFCKIAEQSYIEKLKVQCKMMQFLALRDLFLYTFSPEHVDAQSEAVVLQ